MADRYRDDARRLCVQLLPHTTSVQNVDIIAAALRQVVVDTARVVRQRCAEVALHEMDYDDVRQHTAAKTACSNIAAAILALDLSEVVKNG